MVAIQKKDQAMANMLLDAHAKIGIMSQDGPPLHLAIREEDEDMVGLLIERGANLEGQDLPGWTPLWAAIGLDETE